jgi:hypothetical protein
MKRFGSAAWNGNLRDGKDTVSTQSHALDSYPYSYCRIRPDVITAMSSRPVMRSCSVALAHAYVRPSCWWPWARWASAWHIVLSAAKRPSRLDYARVCECAKAGVVSCVSLEPIINARLTAASHERRWSARLNGADLTAQGGKARSGACNAGRRVLMLALEADLERLDERGDRVVGFANPSGGFRVD